MGASPKEILYVDVDLRNPAERLKLAGIRRCADAYGWKVRTVAKRYSRPEGLKSILRRRKPIGCIVECSAERQDLPPRVFGAVPVVYLDCRESLYGKRALQVVHDGGSTAKVAFRELSTHRPVMYAMVGWKRKVFWSSLREKAFLALVRAKGARCRIFRADRPGFRARLQEWVAQLPKKSGLFAVNDEMAEEVVFACQRAGRKIPQDLIVLGVDNCSRCLGGNSPGVSSIQIDFELAGFRSAELLCRVLNGVRGTNVFTFGPLLVERRESTGGFGRCEQRIANAVDLIRREACNGLRARDVLKVLSGSRRLSELRFRESVGHSILDEIVSVRMDHVFQLLRNRSVSIDEVITSSGFNTGAALRKSFKLRTGLSLAEWRKRNICAKVKLSSLRI